MKAGPRKYKNCHIRNHIERGLMMAPANPKAVPKFVVKELIIVASAMNTKSKGPEKRRYQPTT